MAKRRANWLPTIKSRESPLLICMQVACQILLGKFWWGLQLCFRSHLNKRFEKNYGPPKSQESQFRKFRDSQFGSPKTKWHLGVDLVAKHKKYYKGKVVASPKSKLWWILWICVCPWFIHAPRVLQLCINQLVIWFVQACANIDPLVTLPNPYPRAPTHPFYPQSVVN